MRWLIIPFLLSPISSLFGQGLTVSDVQTVVAQAVQEAKIVAPNSVIAILDREGFVLAVWDVNGGSAPTHLDVAKVVSRAGAAAYLSSDQHAFTTRTAGFIIQQNFPPGVENRPNGPLVGVNFSSMAFSDTNKYKAPPAGGGAFPSPPVPGVNDLGSATPADFFRSVPFTALALSGNPGGVPLYKNGKLVGGLGVLDPTNDPAFAKFDTTFKASEAERIALSGQAGFRPAPGFDGSNVFIDGIRLAYTVGSGSEATVPGTPAAFLAANGNAVTFADIDGIPASGDDLPVDYSPKASPAPVVYPNTFGLVGVNSTPGELRSAIRADPKAGLINGEARLTAAEVTNILNLAAQRSTITRAGIRLPRGQAARVWITVVSNPANDQEEPAVLGTYRTPDATIFSWDVSIQKARTAIFFSRGTERGTPRAFSCRAVGWLSQSMYPPGINNQPAGPLSGVQEIFSVTDVGGGAIRVPLQPINTNLPNGITIFPGGFPLYRNGVLIGAIGVSGDGIEQDDIVGAAGSKDFVAPTGSRSDDRVYQNARIPYAKFPRAATSF
ncbi:MAG: GlcG/HbpS family heme-binding protein [Luteolibacter sp.]